MPVPGRPHYSHAADVHKSEPGQPLRPRSHLLHHHVLYIFVGVADRFMGAIETIRKSCFTPTSVWGYSRGLTLFSYPACWILRMDEAPVDAWLYFPGLKVGKLYLYYSLMTTGFEMNRDLVRNTIVFELGRCL